MDANERDIKLARLVESEHGAVLVEVIDVWIAGILNNLRVATIEEYPKIVGAWLDMEQFKNHIVKTPKVISAINEMNKINEQTI
jgi:hypothetical protein